MLINIRNFVITFFVSALIFGVAAYFISDVVTDSFSVKSEETESDQSVQSPIDDPIFSSSKNRRTFTALLIGTDYTGVNKDYDLTQVNDNAEGMYYKERMICADAILLVHIDCAANEIVISSIPGDMNVTLNGVSIPLGQLYDIVDISYFREIVGLLTGISIDKHFIVSIDGLRKIIDEIGGIEFEVPTDMNYNDWSQDLYINIKAGKQMLDGEKALQMLRYVSYSEGNVTRMNLGVKFIKELFNTLSASSNLKKATKLYASFTANISTDFGISDLANNLDIIFSYPSYKLVEFTYPVSTSYNEEKGINESTPNTAKAYSFFNRYKTVIK